MVQLPPLLETKLFGSSTQLDGLEEGDDDDCAETDTRTQKNIQRRVCLMINADNLQTNPFQIFLNIQCLSAAAYVTCGRWALAPKNYEILCVTHHSKFDCNIVKYIRVILCKRGCLIPAAAGDIVIL